MDETGCRVQSIDGIEFRLKSPFDFSFLKNYGRVFKVFDDQDSGNICFGIADGLKKYFVKFAGAPTLYGSERAEEAIGRMNNSAPIYIDLAHPVLTKLIRTEETGGGRAAVFEYIGGECMGMQYPRSREKFMCTPICTRLKIFDDILSFHAYVAKKNYVAIDFYDGCVLYDFENERTAVCDVEFYSKSPYINTMGRMWGSSRFMSPEEFQLGAVIDEVTNVYAMGATAFALFGDEKDRRADKWMFKAEPFDVAKRAVSDERENRQGSIAEFISEWNAALNKLKRN